jgi:hypothetical protein
MWSSPNRFRPYASFFIANIDLHFVDCRGSFSLYETMEHFPTERGTRQRWKHAAQRRILTRLGSAAMRLMRECVGRGTCKDLMLQ